jgi:predicted nucleic acid-binding Zn ribbon protein
MQQRDKKGIGIRKSDTVSLREAMNELLNTYRLNSRYSQTHLKTNWQEVAGKTIASRTTKIFFKNDVMFIEVSSAPLKHQMVYGKETLLNRIREKYGSELVKEIVLL